MSTNYREFKAKPKRTQEYRAGDVVGAQANQKLLAKGTRNGQVAWKIVCTGCGTSPGLVTEDRLDSYKCPSSICLGTSRVQGDERVWRQAPARDVYQPVRQSDLTIQRRKEAQEAAAQAEKIHQEQIRREQAAKEAAQKEYTERMNRAAQAFVKYHQTAPGDRGTAIAEYCLARGWRQNEEGVKTAIAELNDPKIYQAMFQGGN